MVYDTRQQGWYLARLYDQKGGYYEDNNDRIPWWAWVLMIPGFILAPVFWFVYDLFNPSKLKRDREAYWKSRGSDDTTTA